MTRAKPTKSPAFQFYPSNFLGSPKVRAMNAAQVGVYWLLCCIEWEHGGFTIDDARECAESVQVGAAEFDVMWVKLSRCFVERENRFFSPRLDKERGKQRAWRRKSSRGGKIGMAKRWGEKDNHPITTLTPPDNTPFPSPTPTQLLTTPATDVAKPKRKAVGIPAYDSVFEEAWAAYPKRPNNSKADAWRQWLARVKEGADPVVMLAGAVAYQRHVERTRTEAKFVKMAATFFGKGRHWESDYGPAAEVEPTPEQVFARVFHTTPESIKALWAEEDAARVVDGRKIA